MTESLKRQAQEKWLSKESLDESDGLEPDEEGKSSCSAASDVSASEARAADVTRTDMATFVTVAKKSSNADMAHVYERYQACARFDEKKRQIVALWKTDKSCKWWNTWEHQEGIENKSETCGYQGFGTRFDVAHLLHMPGDAPELDAILDELPCDDLWDDRNAIERGYLTAKLKRYSLTKIDRLIKESQVHVEKENLTASSDSKTSRKPFNVGGSPGKTKIKIENQGFVDLNNKAKVLKSAKGRLEKDLGNSEDVLASLVARNKVGQFKDLIERVEAIHVELEKFLKDLRSFIAEMAMLVVSDDIPLELLQRADELIRAAEAHHKGMPDLIKEMKNSR